MVDDFVDGAGMIRSHTMDLPKRVRKMLEALLGPLGQTDPDLRRAVFQQTRTGSETPDLQPDELRQLVKKIDQHPELVNDEDFLKLRQAGYSEDHTFELTVAAAVGAGVRRFEAGLRAIEAAGTDETGDHHRDHVLSTPANTRIANENAGDR